MNLENRVILCVGSNYQKEKNMEWAIRLLQERFPCLCFSVPVTTQPDHYPQSIGPFLNAAAVGVVSVELEEMKSCLKQLEQQLGRRPGDKVQGRVVIDLDLLQWNEQVLKPMDLTRDYVRRCLASLIAMGDQT
ncbi:MAG: 2-amino-4-hydroxy-6-hydroxymethyldihydropteridine diphosphokinase [Parabacteroides sp.]